MSICELKNNCFEVVLGGHPLIHPLSFLHGDLKQANLLLDIKSKFIKLVGFEKDTLKVSNKLLEISCDSSHYAYPEIVMGTHYYGGLSGRLGPVILYIPPLLFIDWPFVI